MGGYMLWIGISFMLFFTFACEKATGKTPTPNVSTNTVQKPPLPQPITRIYDSDITPKLPLSE